MTRLLAKLSICPCGYPVLHDSIGIGTEYEIYPETLRGGFKYTCGGCGRTHFGVSVLDADCVSNPSRSPAPLPAALFDMGRGGLAGTVNSHSPDAQEKGKTEE